MMFIRRWRGVVSVLVLVVIQCNIARGQIDSTTETGKKTTWDFSGLLTDDSVYTPYSKFNIPTFPDYKDYTLNWNQYTPEPETSYTYSGSYTYFVPIPIGLIATCIAVCCCKSYRRGKRNDQTTVTLGRSSRRGIHNPSFQAAPPAGRIRSPQTTNERQVLPGSGPIGSKTTPITRPSINVQRPVNVQGASPSPAVSIDMSIPPLPYHSRVARSHAERESRLATSASQQPTQQGISTNNGTHDHTASHHETDNGFAHLHPKDEPMGSPPSYESACADSPHPTM